MSALQGLFFFLCGLLIGGILVGQRAAQQSPQIAGPQSEWFCEADQPVCWTRP